MCALRVKRCSTVPKKGDLFCCDNWKGISRLDVMGKRWARVLNDRLQLMVQETVSLLSAGSGLVEVVLI